MYWLLKEAGKLPKKKVNTDHVFITGAASGIGRMMGNEFLKLGSKVTFSDVNEKALKETIDELPQELKQKAFSVKCDVGCPESIAQAAKLARQALGEVTILINNAGIVHGKKILDVSPKLVEQTFKVNAMGHIFTIKEFLPGMIKAKRGHIVTIGSLASVVGVNGMADYCGTKAATNAIDDSLRMELVELGISSFIKTTLVNPYYINTGMFDGLKSFLPILEAQPTVDRIIQGILQEEVSFTVPAYLSSIYAIKGILPARAFDALMRILQVDKALTEFKGRPKL